MKWPGRKTALHTPALCTLALLIAAAQPPPARGAFDPHAIELLDGMADAYTHLRALDQRTEFTSALIASGQPQNGLINGKPEKMRRSLHIEYLEPNLLFLETSDGGTSDRPSVSQWISDGRNFWTYEQDKQAFTEEKAPPSIRDFRSLSRMNSGSLEVLMLMDINPFTGIKDLVDSATVEPEETIDGVQTDLVALHAETRMDKTELRLYIGANDHLLRRMVLDRTPTPQVGNPAKIGDALDDLYAPPAGSSSEGDQPPPGYTPPPKIAAGPGFVPGAVTTRVQYDNKVDTAPTLTRVNFVFQRPARAEQYRNYNESVHSARASSQQILEQFLKAAREGRPKHVKAYHF